MTFTDYLICQTKCADQLSTSARLFAAARRSLYRAIVPAGLFTAFTAVQANASLPPDLNLTCMSGGSLAHVQSLNAPYKTTGENSLAGKTLSITAVVITDPSVKLFAPKPKQPVYTLDVSMGDELLFRIAAQSYDDSRLSDYPERLALVDAFGSGSSLMLLADGTGAWKGRVIRTEGILDRNPTDVTIYIALTCRKAEQGARPEASQ